MYAVTVILKGAQFANHPQFSSMFAAEYFLEEVVAGDYYDRKRCPESCFRMMALFFVSGGLPLRFYWK